MLVEEILTESGPLPHSALYRDLTDRVGPMKAASMLRKAEANGTIESVSGLYRLTESKEVD